MAERLDLDLSSLGKISTWDGSSISETKNCDECAYLRLTQDDIRICVWGVAWKLLEKASNLRMCEKRLRQRPRYPTLIGR